MPDGKHEGGKNLAACCIGYCRTCKELVYNDEDVNRLIGLSGVGHTLQVFNYCPDCGKELPKE